MKRCLGVAALASLAAPALQAQPADVVLPPLSVTRYDEAWNVLADGHPSGGKWSDRLKYVALDEAGRAWLTLGLELRARNEDYRNNFWDSTPAPDDGYLWLRALPYGDLHVGPLRAFVQPVIAYAVDLATKPGPVDETGIDILQGFADVALPLGAAGTLTLRGGRELLAFGSERLVGTRYGPNVPLAFDGARVILERDRLTANLLYVRPVQVGPDNFDDQTSTRKSLWGLYTTRLDAFGPGIGADAYYLGFLNEDAVWNQGAGRELRHTLGVRLFDTGAPLHFNIEAMAQFGTFAGGTIGAWSVATEVGYFAQQAPFAPDLVLRVNVASGDGNLADNRLGTFNAMFPKGKYFGELSPIGPYNVININPHATVSLGHGLAAGLAGGLYWRASKADGIYGIPGNLIRSGAGTDARFIGTQAEFTLDWEPTPSLDMSASASIFTAGSFIRATGPAPTIGMLGFEIAYKF